MRLPIQVQLLIPLLAVVILAISLASLSSAYFGSSRAHQQQEASLRRVVSTLAQSQFPLTEGVLRQIGGLSGAELVFFGPGGKVQSATLPLGKELLGLRRPSATRPARPRMKC